MNDKFEIYATKEAAVAADAQEIKDMHGRFVTWYKWWFFVYISLLVLPCFSWAVRLISESLGNFIHGCLMLGLTCAANAAFICGLIWRFNSIGRFAAGDIVPVGTDP